MIFDCDGVLVDSESASAAAWQAALARFDYHIDGETFARVRRDDRSRPGDCVCRHVGGRAWRRSSPPPRRR